MRLIGSLENEKQARQFSAFLKTKNIDNEIELAKNTDWESPQYATAECRIWVIDEDDLDAADKWWALFTENPQDPRFKETGFIKTLGKDKESSDKPPPLSETQHKAKVLISKNRAVQTKPMGPVTFYLLLICTLLFIFSRLTAPSITQPIPNLPYTPLFSSPVNKELMYDYPPSYEIIDRLIQAYGVEELTRPQDLPAAGKTLLQKFYNTPTWSGYYPLIVRNLVNGETQMEPNAPMFVKIQEGEVWRLFTPTLLHSDLFHLFFNMIWLLILGRQMEDKLGAFRLLLFIAITGILSNTAQYLMTGPNFIGFSGVLCAMIAFIWIRQRNKPWEGYSLQSGTINFIAIFVLLMFGISFISFLSEVYSGTRIGPNIANTAHLSGALFGYLLGKVRLFKAKGH